MHVLENSFGIFVAGEGINRYLENFRHAKKNFPKYSAIIFKHHIPSSPPHECDRFDLYEVSLHEFIRNYLDCPHAD